MKKIFEGFLIAFMGLMSVFSILNFFSGIIATIWLIAIGGWALVVAGIILGLIMPWAYSLASSLSILIIPLFVKSAESGKAFFTLLLGFIAAFWNYFLLSLWISFIFGVMIEFEYPAMALWLWGFATVMGPVTFMASKEDQGSFGAVLGVLFSQIGYTFLTFSYYFLGREELGYSFLWLLLIVSAGLSAYLGLLVSSENKEAGATNERMLEEASVEVKEIAASSQKATSSDGKIYCTQCGEKIGSRSHSFCTHCGASLKG